MKRNLLLIIIAFLTSNLVAQITVTNATFPEAGDTLRFAVDGEPSINLQDAGEDITWNFTFLDGPTFENILQDAQDGSAFNSFSNATILAGLPTLGEIYYNTTSTQYSLLGYSGGDPIGLGLDIVAKNFPALVEQVAPLNYGDEYDFESVSRTALAWDDLPSFLTDSLGGGFPISPDSIAVELHTERTEEVDAWGRVFIPGGNFETLRVRRWDVVEQRVAAKVPIFGWIDVTDQISGLFTPPDGSGGLGTDTTLTYRYYSNDSKEAIAIITADPMTEEPTDAQYKAIDLTTNIIKLHKKKPSIHAYPNPAFEDVRIDIVNVPSGDYKLKIFNILGMEVWNNEYHFHNQNDTIMIDVTRFKKGTYLYCLENEKGKRLATKRLTILRP